MQSSGPSAYALGVATAPYTQTLQNLARSQQTVAQQSGMQQPHAPMMIPRQNPVQPAPTKIFQPQPQGSQGTAQPSSYKQGEQGGGKRSSKKEDANFGLVLPIHKVKKLIKAEGDVKAISGEGSFAISRVTELFIEELTRRAYQRMIAKNPNSQNLEYDDLSGVVKRWTATDFLLDIVPETVTLEELEAILQRREESEKVQLGTRAL